MDRSKLEEEREVISEQSFSRDCMDTRLRTDYDFPLSEYEQARSYQMGVKSPYKDDFSFHLTDSFALSFDTETLVTAVVETEHTQKRSETVYPNQPAPFMNKPQFARQVRWKKPLVILLSEDCEDCEDSAELSPTREDVARYPKPSVGKWQKGTKRGYEDEFYYRDVGVGV